jgi:hypothetical protein
MVPLLRLRGSWPFVTVRSLKLLTESINREIHAVERENRLRRSASAVAADRQLADAGGKGQRPRNIVGRALLDTVDRQRSNKPKSCESMHREPLSAAPSNGILRHCFHRRFANATSVHAL